MTAVPLPAALTVEVAEARARAAALARVTPLPSEVAVMARLQLLGQLTESATMLEEVEAPALVAPLPSAMVAVARFAPPAGPMEVD